MPVESRLLISNHSYSCLIDFHTVAQCLLNALVNKLFLTLLIKFLSLINIYTFIRFFIQQV